MWLWGAIYWYEKTHPIYEKMHTISGSRIFHPMKLCGKYEKSKSRT